MELNLNKNKKKQNKKKKFGLVMFPFLKWNCVGEVSGQHQHMGV